MEMEAYRKNGGSMANIPDIQTQQKHRATLRKKYFSQANNEMLRKALLKSLRSEYIAQAAQKGVFICYSMQDGVFALDLALALREAGIRAFLDELEADDDMDWGDTVSQALRDCAVLIMVLSPDSVEDAEVRGEYTYFMRKGKIVVPVIATKCDYSKLQTLIEPLDFVADYDATLTKLKSLLSNNEGAKA